MAAHIGVDRGSLYRGRQWQLIYPCVVVDVVERQYLLVKSFIQQQ